MPCKHTCPQHSFHSVLQQPSLLCYASQSPAANMQSYTGNVLCILYDGVILCTLGHAALGSIVACTSLGAEHVFTFAGVETMQGIKWRQAAVLSQLKTIAEAAKVLLFFDGLPWRLSTCALLMLLTTLGFMFARYLCTAIQFCSGWSLVSCVKLYLHPYTFHEHKTTQQGWPKASTQRCSKATP